MNWLLFYLRFVAIVGLLYVPGILMIPVRSERRFSVLAVAPFASIIFITFEMALFYKLEIALPWQAFVGPIALIALITLFFNIRRGLSVFQTIALWNVRSACLYLLVGLIVTTLIFVKNLDGVSSFVPLFDNASALSRVEVFRTTSMYGPVISSLYSDTSVLFQGATYYPSVFHCFAALIANMTSCSSAEAINVLLFAIIAIVFPLSFRGFLLAVFPDKPRVQLFGSIASMSFGAFPWGLLVFGPLYPNIFSFAFIPAFVSLFYLIFESDSRQKRELADTVSLLGAFLIVLALIHPNGLFAAGVICIPIVIRAASSFAKSLSSKHERVCASVGAVISAVLICFIWFFCYKIPFMRAVVDFDWPAFRSWGDGISTSLSLGFSDLPAQLIVSILSIAGIVLCILKLERAGVFGVSFFLCLGIYIIDVCMSGDIKHLLSGFWYTDSRRIAAFAVLSLMPFFAYALNSIYERIEQYCLQFRNRRSARIVSLVFCGVISLAVFAPSYSLPGIASCQTCFSFVRKSLAALNNLSVDIKLNGADERLMLDSQECTAGKDIKEIIGSSSGVILNNAMDGSPFLYGLDDLNMFYRSCVQEDASDDRGLRMNIDRYAYDSATRKLVEKNHIVYVLQLDCDSGNSDRSTFHAFYNPDYWRGIQDVSSDTPGFELVYSRGDIRLYKLTDF